MTDIIYELKRSKRKTISVEISREAKVIVRAPLKMKMEEINAFINSKKTWIITNLSQMEKMLKEAPEKLDENEIKALKKRAKALILPKVEYYANRMGVTYDGIAFRRQKTRFGSCSSKKNLNFNIAVALMPEEIVDYVIVHELSHLREMNHSPRFWREVESIIPDFKMRRKWLQKNGIKYIQKII